MLTFLHDVLWFLNKSNIGREWFKKKMHSLDAIVSFKIYTVVNIY